MLFGRHFFEGGQSLPKQCFGTSHVPLSPAVRAGDMVYVSGQVPVGSDGVVVAGGIVEQTEQVLSNVKAALALAGCTMDDVVKTTVWLEDARNFGASMPFMPGILQRIRRRGQPSSRG
jgi:2-iminobutanoate/2-iminopropanoate deaminase